MSTTCPRCFGTGQRYNEPARRSSTCGFCGGRGSFEPLPPPPSPDGTVFDTYRLPDGSLVRCDASACKGRRVIDYTLAGGTIVPGVLYSRGK